MTKEEQLYEEEEKSLKHLQKILKEKALDKDQLYDELQKISYQFEELLNNVKLITSISDRFQEKLKLANDQLKDQAEEINRINLALDQDNRSLKGDLTKLTKARVMSHIISYEEFVKAYPTKDSCYKFLAELKWKGEYQCKKCGNEKFCEGKTKFSKRCTKCRYDESPTAYTIFHKCKFEMQKAFYITMLVNAEKGNISSYELSRLLDLRQKTCWSFKQKVMESMKKVKAKKMENVSWDTLSLNP